MFAYYDTDADIAWFPTGESDDVVSERVPDGLRDYDRASHELVAIEVWGASTDYPPASWKACHRPIPPPAPLHVSLPNSSNERLLHRPRLRRSVADYAGRRYAIRPLAPIRQVARLPEYNATPRQVEVPDCFLQQTGKTELGADHSWSQLYVDTFLVVALYK